jgi:hypothetical protein
MKTTNGGITWDTTIARPIANNINDAGFPNALTAAAFGQQYVWFGNSTPNIFYTSNGGFSWTFGSVNGPPPIFSITFSNINTGFAGAL